MLHANVRAGRVDELHVAEMQHDREHAIQLAPRALVEAERAQRAVHHDVVHCWQRLTGRWAAEWESAQFDGSWATLKMRLREKKLGLLFSLKFRTLA